MSEAKPRDPARVRLAVHTALAAVVGAAAPEFLLPGAMAATRRDDDDESGGPLLLHPPAAAGDGWRFAGHKSHSSHKSHASHYSGKGGGGGYAPDPGIVATPKATEPAPPPPPPPAPAYVSFVAMPGGRIYVDDKLVGRDATATMMLTPGKHNVRIENRFIGDETLTVTIGDGQTGVVVLKW